VLEDIATRPLQSAACHIKGTHLLVDSGTTMGKYKQDLIAPAWSCDHLRTCVFMIRIRPIFKS